MDLLIPSHIHTEVSISHYFLTKHRVLVFSLVQSLSHVQLFVTPWTAALQASLSSTNSQSAPKPMSIESVMPSKHLILCHLLLLLLSVFPSIRVFSNESAVHSRWPKYWSFSFNISPSNEHPGLIILVLVLAFINNVHELKNKKKNKTKKQAQFQNKIQVPAKYFPYPTKLQSIYMGFSPFLVLTQLWLSFPLRPLPSTNKGFKLPTWVLHKWLQIFCAWPYLLCLQRWVC